MKLSKSELKKRDKKLSATKTKISKEYAKYREKKQSIKIKFKGDKEKIKILSSKELQKTKSKISNVWGSYSEFRDLELKHVLHSKSKGKFKVAEFENFTVKSYPKIDDKRNNINIQKTFTQIIKSRKKEIRYFMLIVEVPISLFDNDNRGSKSNVLKTDYFSEVYNIPSLNKQGGIKNIDFIDNLIQKSKFSQSKNSRSGRIEGLIKSITIKAIYELPK